MPQSNTSYALRMRNVSKRYPGTLAVDCVDFEVRKGEVHALMGENGAGKSSLMKMLAGSFSDYIGDIEINDRDVQLRSPAMAKASGIEMIYQELSLAQPISIAENVLAGRLPRKAGVWLDKSTMLAETHMWLKRVGLEHIDPLAAVETLSPHEAQLVEIAKALSNNPSIVIMDEPTSSLSRKEVHILFDIIAELKAQGLAIVYISHHIPEVFEVSDAVTILRDGKLVGSHPISELTPDRMVEMMVGRSVVDQCNERDASSGERRLRLDNLTRYGFFHEVSFDLHQGEILGIGGLAGSGRTELARCIGGLDPIDEGTIYLEGDELPTGNMRDRLKQGIAYMTEDRKLQGLALDLDLLTNTLTGLNVKESRIVGNRKGMEVFNEQADQLQIYPAEPKRLISQLSGGNQQKILLAKWLATAPRVLILDEPTRGVDIGAKQVIHQAIINLADAGTSIIVISSDLPELVHLSDRVVVLRQGRVFTEMKAGKFTENSILLAANGEDVA
ncbi:sugar ABC transporter ATP-binding protein [Rubellicoccus peritrichatus]|uniref:Sugar ABC transporter ATP-binding protein n=1 Tax=Rubellicoccus peritrichatus TaxID=3080537 RepID=A0AAQ3L6F2_9BACT|nr:sugar ABC transporter ATP-binding protein [Puniceicoccus sp. CR14]WOO39537.1 sugar ABC transporter ATP-binding protein [Puniceicoccus sp. CR14]